MLWVSGLKTLWLGPKGFSYFFSKHFIASHLKSVIRLELIFVCRCEVLVEVHFFAHGDPIVPAACHQGSPPLNCFCCFVKNQWSISVWIGSRPLHSVPSPSLSLYHAASMTVVASQASILGRVIPPASLFLCRIIFAIPRLIPCHIHFRTSCLCVQKA